MTKQLYPLLYNPLPSYFDDQFNPQEFSARCIALSPKGRGVASMHVKIDLWFNTSDQREPFVPSLLDAHFHCHLKPLHSNSVLFYKKQCYKKQYPHILRIKTNEPISTKVRKPSAQKYWAKEQAHERLKNVNTEKNL